MKVRLLMLAGSIALAPLVTRAETVSIDPPAEPVIIASPTVEIALTAKPTSVAVGQEVAYTLTITNAGDAALTDLSAQFELPAGFSFVSGTSPSALKKLGSLAPQTAITKTFTLRVGSGATAGIVPLEVLVDADEFDVNETIAVVDVRNGEVLGAETLVETGGSPLGALLIGFAALTVGFFLQRQRRAK